MQVITFENTPLHVKEDTTHEFLLSNNEVALGYGITQSTLRSTLNNHQDELIEGKHWIRLHVNTKGGRQSLIHWTKKGIVRLGFFIKSKQAKAFRDWAEDYIVNKENDTNFVPYTLLYSKERECIELKRAMNRMTENEKLIFGDVHTHNAVLDLLGYASRATKTIKRLGEELIDYAAHMEKGLETVEKQHSNKKGVPTQCNRLPRHQERRD